MVTGNIQWKEEKKIESSIRTSGRFREIAPVSYLETYRAGDLLFGISFLFFLSEVESFAFL